MGATLAASSGASAATLLVAAGGGGGESYLDIPGGPGLTGTSGGGLTGGINGSGGGGGSDGAGGAGWSGNGVGDVVVLPTLLGSGGGFGPPNFAGGSAGCGGRSETGYDGCGGVGGYGGGGGGGYDNGGGGGGYSGGQGGGQTEGRGFGSGGGGGGSYLSPALTLAASGSGVNGGPNGPADGFVVIGGKMFSYTGSLQSYVIPFTGLYDILAVGAEGGIGCCDSTQAPGYGALMSGLGEFSAGTVLEIVVGGAGGYGHGGGGGGGGGGGSFVYEGSVPEPATWGLMILGLGLIGLAARRRTARLTFGA